MRDVAAAHDRFANDWPRACRAGVIAFALTQLLLAITATPLLSARSTAAHAHPPGTGEHVHPLNEIFPVGPIAAPVRRVDVDLGSVVERVTTLDVHAPATTWARLHEARAPPKLG